MGKEDVRGPTRGSVGSSMLHNLCRYILYVCRYIAQYISMANESNLKSGRNGKISCVGGRGTSCISCFVSRYLARIIPVCSVRSEGEEQDEVRKEGHSRPAAKSCRSR